MGNRFRWRHRGPGNRKMTFDECAAQLAVNWRDVMNQPLYDALKAAGVDHDHAHAAAEAVADKQIMADLIAEIDRMLIDVRQRLAKRRGELGIDDDDGPVGVRNRPTP